jgi:hypothetical protein
MEIRAQLQLRRRHEPTAEERPRTGGLLRLDTGRAQARRAETARMEERALRDRVAGDRHGELSGAAGAG